MEEKNGGKGKTAENSGHYVIASSRLPEHQPLERSIFFHVLLWTFLKHMEVLERFLNIVEQNSERLKELEKRS